MRFTKNKLVWAVAVAVSASMPASVFATNGYFAHGYGTKNKGMGGAGVALPQDALAAATNPAGMAFVGDRFDIGAGIFNPNREYSSSGAGAVSGSQESDANYFVVPHLGYNKMLGSNSSVGVSVYGNGGMNTDYANTVFPGFGSGNTGVDLSQLFVNVSYAYKVMPNAAIGISGILAYQRFEAYGLQNLFGGTNPGYDDATGGGFKFGGQLEVGAGISLGASYQSEMKMSKFDKYAALFAEQGDFDIPSSYTLGAAWKMSPAVAVLFDYQRINYTDVKAVSNPGPTTMADVALFGSNSGPGFGWEDINVYKLGAQFSSGDWTYRAGWNHGDNPIKSSQVMLNILAPGVVQDHLTLGFTKAMSTSSEINFAFMHAFSESVTGAIPAGFGGGTATIKMDQNEAELSYGMKF